MPDETKLNAAIDAAEATALGGDRDGELSAHRAQAIDAFLGKNIEPAPKGRSQVVDWSVFETIQWILPSLTRIFANGDNVVEFMPTGPEDEEAAQQESDYLNYLVTQKNDWFLTLTTWFQDALLTKNAYCMAFIEERIKTEKQSYEGQSDEAVAMLVEDGGEIVEIETYPDEEAEEVYVEDPVTGEPVLLPPPNKHNVVIRHVKPQKKLSFRVLPPERVKVDEATPDFTTRRCNYFEYFEDCTISELRADGFDIPDDLAHDILEEQDSEEEAARSLYNEEIDPDNPPDPSMRKVRVRHIWIRFDYDEDGIAELQHVIRVGNTILSREEASRIPVASIVPFPYTHRHMGGSVADLTFDIQRIKTALLRGGLDSLYLSQNPRHAVSDRVNLNDLLVSRPGGIVRLKDGAVPGEGHVMPLSTEFTLPQTLEGLRHMDTVIESRVGVNRIFQGIDEGQLNDHNRIGQLSTMAAQRVEQIARIFANGVEYLFSLAHELIIKSGHQSETTKLKGSWVTIDPSTWRTGRDMQLVAPFSAGNKDTLLQRLMVLKSIHAEALAGGIPIVTPEDSYELALEISKAADVVGEKFFTDPQMIPPPEPPPDYTMMALEIENKKADNAALDTEVDAEVKRFDISTRAEVDKYIADLKAEVDIALEQLKAGHAVDLKGVEYTLANAPIELQNQEMRGTSKNISSLGELVKELKSSVNDLKSAAEAEREVVRDKNGRVTGIRVNGRLQKVRRDKDGKVTGVG